MGSMSEWRRVRVVVEVPVRGDYTERDFCRAVELALEDTRPDWLWPWASNGRAAFGRVLVKAYGRVQAAAKRA